MGKGKGTTTSTILGSMKPAAANARTVAALTSNPGCTRRRVMDAASVPVYQIAASLGHTADRGQSPFAIVTGDRFEYRLKKGSDYELLVEALRPFIELPTDDLRVLNLNSMRGYKVGKPMLRARAEATRKAMAAIARGDADAPHLVDHPVLIFDLAGTPVFLEPDGLACRVGEMLELVEIKSYAIIDDQADPDKLAATAGQSAVYLLALRLTLEQLGIDPDRVVPSVILVAPRNFGRTPTAHRIPLRKKVMALQRVLQAVPKTDAILADLPANFTLDVDPKEQQPAEERTRALSEAVRKLPMLYVPECLNSCDMAKHCREEAIHRDLPARLGREARDTLAGVPDLEAALRLSKQSPEEVSPELVDVAEGLRRAREALQRAREATSKRTAKDVQRERSTVTQKTAGKPSKKPRSPL